MLNRVQIIRDVAKLKEIDSCVLPWSNGLKAALPKVNAHPLDRPVVDEVTKLGLVSLKVFLTSAAKALEKAWCLLPGQQVTQSCRNAHLTVQSREHFDTLYS